MQIKRILPFLILGLATLPSARAANITVGYQNYNPVYSSDKTTLLSPSSLVWFGSWVDGTDVSAILSGYFGGTQTLSQLTSAFTLATTKVYSDFGDGSESISSTMSDTGLIGRNVEMVFWNSSSVNTASQAASFRWANSAYPDGASLDTEVNVANALPSYPDPDIAVSVIYGTVQDSGSDGVGTISTIPEPTIASLLVGAGVLLFASRRPANLKL
jgi:hypothetical protein